MKEYLDIIGIGAINFDYVFFCKKLEYKNRLLPEFGQEYLNITRDAIYEDINKLLYTTTYTTQICGSSYFALKTANAIFPQLKLAYVGVCGKPTKKELDAGFQPNIKDEFSFLSNKEWLFFDNDEPGVALIRVAKGTRSWIDIDAGANSKLQKYIIDKECKEGEDSFVEYLSRSKWIHVSSLADFKQFQFIIEKVKSAKEINPLLKISIDPGYEYTKKYKVELKEAFSIADYVFLNNNEVENLIGDSSLNINNKYSILATVFNNYKLSNSQVIIIKSKSRHTLVSFKDGKLAVSNFWHHKLSMRKIKNDTGAGDAFAGGFIGSMLSTRLLTHQPAPIRIGAISAMARMRCINAPFEAIANDTKLYIKTIETDEVFNVRQKCKLIFEKIQHQISTFFIGIVTGVIGSLIVLWIQWLCKINI